MQTNRKRKLLAVKGLAICSLVFFNYSALELHGQVVSVVSSPDITQTNPYYPGNRPPLVPSPFIRLPTGSVHPQGWLRHQLKLEAAGYIGHMEEVSPFLNPVNNAWLRTTGEGDNYWEEVPYWLRGYTSLAFALEEPQMIDKAKKWLEPSLVGQRANGYFGTKALEGDNDHAPDLMPNQNMLYAYRAYYEATKDPRVLNLIARYFQWELRLDDQKFFNGGWGAARDSDNMDMVLWLYNRTGDHTLLDLARKLMSAGDSWMHAPNGGHNVAFAQGFRKPAVSYQVNHDPEYLKQMENNYNGIYDIYGQVPGGMFGGDEFARLGHTDPHQAIETCGVVEMMFSDEILLRITGDLKWMDRCENIAYNTLPATTTADFCALRYLTAPNQSNSDARSKFPTFADGGPMQVMDPRSHRCCQHNLACAWPYFTESLYEATPDSGLAAMMYAPCSVTARVGTGSIVTIDQITQYPFADQVTLAVSIDKATGFPLYLRIPNWCNHPSIELNKQVVPITASGSRLVKISRVWRQGDQIRLSFPMEIAITQWSKNHNGVSVNRGPLTYSVKIDEAMVPTPAQKTWPAYEIHPGSPWNYGLLLNRSSISSNFQVITRPFFDENQPFSLNGAPIELKVQAKQITNWTENLFGVVDTLQSSPVASDEPIRTITMIPMGCGRLRMSALPVIGEGVGANPWLKTPEPISSCSEDPGIVNTLTDPRDPKDSTDNSIGMFSMYDRDSFGSTQWVRMPFLKARTVSKVKTYWWTEHYESGGIRAPASWSLLYKDRDGWKPVNNPSPCKSDLNCYDEMTFDPVATTELKMVIKFQEGRCASLIRWRVQ